jgi:hypothetical protein
VLDLPAQAVDLHVDGTLPGRAIVAGERLPRHRLAGGGGEQAQNVALATREPHDLLAALELTATEMEAEVAEAVAVRLLTITGPASACRATSTAYCTAGLLNFRRQKLRKVLMVT